MRRDRSAGKAVSRVMLAFGIVLVPACFASAQGPAAKKTREKIPLAYFDDPEEIRQRLLKAGESEHREAMRYKGHRVIPQDTARGERLRIQRQFASDLGRLDFVPDARAEHFQWFERQLAARIVGWKSEILEMVASPGGYHIKTRVSMIHSAKTIVTEDYVIETYEYTDLGIRLLHVECPESTQGALCF